MTTDDSFPAMGLEPLERLPAASTWLIRLRGRLTKVRLLGWGDLPQQGPVMLVGNHTLMGLYDTPLLLHEVHRPRGATAPARGAPPTRRRAPRHGPRSRSTVSRSTSLVMRPPLGTWASSSSPSGGSDGLSRRTEQRRHGEETGEPGLRDPTQGCFDGYISQRREPFTTADEAVEGATPHRPARVASLLLRILTQTFSRWFVARDDGRERAR